ncbi:MAG: tRNA (adenosine(37)-N6)-dimethylallyltransferase MiaA [Bacteroidales bacterium]|nr:tRNA (adenosine(37)-N6)-dimethylallyltransferase MiaA [Bacteroidales bacterium]
MITILGPTAAGKTILATYLAYHLNGEIISADSRQVYKGMDLGTGKDYEDYIINGKKVKYHLVDIVEPGYEYNVYEFQRDFLKSYNKIIEDGAIPILCGGTGLYLEAVLKGYKLIEVPENNELRVELNLKQVEELIILLKSFGHLHNVSDINDKARIIRAIEIQQYHKEHKEIIEDFPKIKNVIFGVFYERKIIRDRITKRLKLRLNDGMIEEVKGLLNKGLIPEQLIFYGLEYKFITQYIIGQITYDEMFSLLNTAIHQFAKRQMTWFRKMERNGFKIHWIDGEKDIETKRDVVLQSLKV